MIEAMDDAVGSEDKDQAVLAIGGILDQVSVMGVNDREIPVLRRLMDEVRSGDTDPGKALEEARAILASKQDYH